MNNYPLLNAFLTMLWFFLWILWFMLLFRVIADVFRDDDLSGWAKAGWVILVCVLPFLGVFAYLIARGRGMGEREARRAQRQEQAFRQYIREAAHEEPTAAATAPAPRSGVDELERLAGLRAHGDISEDEYQRAKDHLLRV
ncbi:SHOCT domain-containing protein [Amycolatopsis taiwanensis]|uniref:SHOCT domain-containing protein n=1 Tax=Amycolatopsis taiwanensis TaxID=342230 RepID=UPI0004889D71|nr:SHOCT domain-containing protein [Amycolatopsis taiwanensis]